jgi:formate dehydrogenase major subunit
MLRKKTSGVANGPLSSSFIGKAAETVVDRRAFLRGSGLAIGGLATACSIGWVKCDASSSCRLSSIS